MHLFLQVFIFIVGISLTIKGGDIFVNSATIGATLVSFATTLPELVVSVTVAINNKTDVSIGNAVGSVIANTNIYYFVL